MKHIFIFCLMFFFLKLGFTGAQPSNNLKMNASTYLDATHCALMIQTLGAQEDEKHIAQKFAQLANLLVKYQKKTSKTALGKNTSKKMLRYLFYHTHRLFLRRYRTHSPKNQFFAKGEYDCVSGSAWLAFVLKQTSYAVEIHETPFHVYLVVRLADGDRVLLESTNSVEGFIDNENQISLLEKEYTLAQSEGKQPYQKSFNHIIDFEELMGLQIYNQAVWYFNAQKFEKAQVLLEKAHTFYQVDRISALNALCLELLKYPQESIVQEIQKLEK